MLSARGFSFRTDSWARTIVDFYRATPGAGVIGFFGYALKTRSPSLMGGLSRYERASLYQHIGERVVRLESRAGEADFSPVVQVDGQCLIVPKAVWREHPFDEELFRDFHLYDVDFCVCIARRYANYICHSVFGEHGSVGSYDDDRYRNVLLFQRRWDGCLPLTVVPMSPREVRPISFIKGFFPKGGAPTCLSPGACTGATGRDVPICGRSGMLCTMR